MALRLIDRGARLVADDRVDLTVRRGRLMARAPSKLAGLIEVRGIGVVPMPRRRAAEIVLVADLVELKRVKRMPGSDRGPDRCVLAGVSLPRLKLAPFEATAPIKLRLALLRWARPRQRARRP